ncbi:MAG: thermonuclease family protein [Candidatus Nanohalobium sp.]
MGEENGSMKKALPLLVLLAVVASGCSSSSAQNYKEGKVTRVYDGDTFEVKIDGQRDKIKLVGVNAPEIRWENNPVDYRTIPDTRAAMHCLETWGMKAETYINFNLSDEKVKLLNGTENMSQRNEGLQMYVRYNGTSINYFMIKNGYARANEVDHSRKQKYIQAEKNARENNRGLWQCDTPKTPEK